MGLADDRIVKKVLGVPWAMSTVSFTVGKAIETASTGFLDFVESEG